MFKRFATLAAPALVCAALWAQQQAVVVKPNVITETWETRDYSQNGAPKIAHHKLSQVVFPECTYKEVWRAFLQAVPDMGWEITTQDRDDDLLTFHEKANLGANMSAAYFHHSKPNTIEQPGFRCVFDERSGSVYVSVKRLGRGDHDREGSAETEINEKTLGRFTDLINKVAKYVSEQR
jgi:hypothetical protein